MSKDSFEGQKVLVAMSGGVDSNAAAIILRERGFEVSGATMILTEEMRSGATRAGEVCRTIGIDHFVFETKELFVKEVKDSFARKYFSGYTPNPCIVCNSRIKFGAFARKAFRDGFDRIATGHYCELVRDDGGLHLMKGYGDKDQTYFLSMTDPEILKRVIFPVGSMDKETVRKKVRETAFPKADGKDSQDICFVPGGDYVKVLSEYRGSADAENAFSEGDFTDGSGVFQGRHKGFVRYTIGQRKGLGIACGEPKYVTDICPSSRQVRLGSEAELFSDFLLCGRMNMINADAFHRAEREGRLEAKVRYTPKTHRVNIQPYGDALKVVFEEKVRAAAPGQYVVFYCGSECLGGAEIIKQNNKGQ